MNQPKDMASPDVLLGLVRRLIAEYFERTERGETFDMQPVESGIEAFCKRLGELPKPEASRYESGLEELMQDLTRLGQLMQSKQQAIADSLRDAGTMKKANKAYQMSEAYALPPGVQKVAKDLSGGDE